MENKKYKGLVKATYSDFESFLRAQKNDRWIVDSQYLQACLPGIPATVDELMDAISYTGDGTEYIYVFNGNEEDPFEMTTCDFHALPTVGEEGLRDCILYSVKGRDFIWFDTTIDQASNANPVVLLPYEEDQD